MTFAKEMKMTISNNLHFTFFETNGVGIKIWPKFLCNFYESKFLVNPEVHCVVIWRRAKLSNCLFFYSFQERFKGGTREVCIVLYNVIDDL